MKIKNAIFIDLFNVISQICDDLYGRHTGGLAVACLQGRSQGFEYTEDSLL